MDGWLIFVVVLTFVFLFVALGVLIWYVPCKQPPNTTKQPRQVNASSFIVGARSQVGTDVLPTIDIGTTATDIELNQPFSESGYTKIVRSGVYSVSYGVDAQFEGEALASFAVRRRAENGANGFEILAASVRQVACSHASQVPVNNTFVAQLNAGDQLKITATASAANMVSVPSSDKAFLQTPTTLASLTLTIIPSF